MKDIIRVIATSAILVGPFSSSLKAIAEVDANDR